MKQQCFKTMSNERQGSFEMGKKLGESPVSTRKEFPGLLRKEEPRQAPVSPWVEERSGVQGNQGSQSSWGKLPKRRELHRQENSGEPQRVPLKSSAKWRSVHICEKTTQSQEKDHPKGWEGTRLQTHTGLGIVPVPNASVEDIKIHEIL